ncbi:MAG: hypothetical protein JJ855_14650 [Rhodospirillales bacterium]|nr:hypothetical protein [Rhodospirillales bacterium]
MAQEEQVRDCGDCTLCCKITRIDTPELQSLPGTWCQHCTPGKGCGNYENRPKVCRTFVCLWAQGKVPIELKPNKVKAVMKMSGDGKNIVALLDTGITPDKVQPGLRNYLKMRAREGVKGALVPLGDKDHVIFT